MIPVVAPFLIGLIVGVIIKRAFKLIVVVIALVLILIAFGYMAMPSLPGFGELFQNAMKYLPLIQKEGGALVNLFPYSSASFLVGLGLGVWRG